MMSQSDERDIELMSRLKRATSVQEILEITRLLRWDFSEEEAREMLALITPTEPKEMELEDNAPPKSMTMVDWTVEAMLCEDKERQAKLFDKAFESGVKEGIITGIVNQTKTTAKESQWLSAISKLEAIQDAIDDERIRKILATRGIDSSSMNTEQWNVRLDVLLANNPQEKEKAFRALFDTYNLDVGKELTEKELSSLMVGQKEYFSIKYYFYKEM